MIDTYPSTVSVLRALRDGYGVEDIHAMQIADADFARHVIAKLRGMGMLKAWVLA